MHSLILPPKSVWWGFFLKLLKCKKLRTSVTFFNICWKSGCWKENNFNNELVFLPGIFCNFFFFFFLVHGGNCLKLLPISAEIVPRQHHALKWKVDLENLSESLLEWMETSPFLKVSLWARPCEPCNGMSGINQVNEDKKKSDLCYFLCSFPALGLPTSPASFILSFSWGSG